MTKKVIIIDDSTTSRNLIKNKFISAGWDVREASSAKEGYSLVFDVAPDLIITDAIMPFIGGFQFVRMLRDNPRTSEIPVIIYSVLPENNAKFYMKNNYIEYFLSKKDNIDELISLSENVIAQHPLDENYKNGILESKFAATPVKQELKIPDALDEEDKLNQEELRKRIKEICDFKHSDEKIFCDFFKIMYPILNYELCVISPQKASEGKKVAFFDIRGIILSPIFQAKMLENYGATDSVLYKKYAPNMKTITNEDEFNSKVEFSFKYEDKPFADIVFLSREESKWQNVEEMEIIKNVTYDFLEAYYASKNIAQPKKTNFGKRYFSYKFNNLNTQEPANKDKIAFIGVLSITNYTDIVTYLTKEDADILSSKISEILVKYLNNDEQAIKNDEDEYLILIQVKEYENAIDKFNFLISTLEQIKYNNFSLEAAVGASECNINGSYNLFEAQNHAYKALEKTSATEKTVIYNATE